MTRIMVECPADWFGGDDPTPLEVGRAYDTLLASSLRVARATGLDAVESVARRFHIDALRTPVRVRAPATLPTTAMLRPMALRERHTMVIFGELGDALPPPVVLATLAQHGIIVHSDPVIGGFPVDMADPAVGTHGDVWKVHGGPELVARGLDGAGVHLAIVDTGLNLATLAAPSLPLLAANGNWAPPGRTPGRMTEGHGSMCAFDARILAPKSTLVDCAVTSQQPTFPTVLSNALIAYEGLLNLLKGMPAHARALVINNSWGLVKAGDDDPPGSYSAGAHHPFTAKVRELTAAGADVVFAAGNFGDAREATARGFADKTICGANSDGSVITVAGVDVSRQRASYSSRGPGQLTAQKPDLAACTHFWGYFGRTSTKQTTPDSGTSAACAVLSGLIAAIRTRYPAAKLSPADLRRRLRDASRQPAGPAGFNLELGAGVIDVPALLGALPSP